MQHTNRFSITMQHNFIGRGDIKVGTCFNQIDIILTKFTFILFKQRQHDLLVTKTLINT